MTQTNHFSVYYQVKDDSEDTGKPDWVDFRRLVWHKAVAEVVNSLEPMTRFAPTVLCADGESRQVVPHISMFSVDYDEQ